MGGLAERRHETVAVTGAGRQRHVARLDAFQGDRGEVRAGAFGARPARDDGHGLPCGDELVLVLDGLDDGTVGAGLPSGRGSMRQKALQSGSDFRTRGRGSSALRSLSGGER